VQIEVLREPFLFGNSPPPSFIENCGERGLCERLLHRLSLIQAGPGAASPAAEKTYRKRFFKLAADLGIEDQEVLQEALGRYLTLWLPAVPADPQEPPKGGAALPGESRSAREKLSQRDFEGEHVSSKLEGLHDIFGHSRSPGPLPARPEDGLIAYRSSGRLSDGLQAAHSKTLPDQTLLAKYSATRDHSYSTVKITAPPIDEDVLHALQTGEEPPPKTKDPTDSWWYRTKEGWNTTYALRMMEAMGKVEEAKEKIDGACGGKGSALGCLGGRIKKGWYSGVAAIDSIGMNFTNPWSGEGSGGRNLANFAYSATPVGGVHFALKDWSQDPTDKVKAAFVVASVIPFVGVARRVTTAAKVSSQGTFLASDISGKGLQIMREGATAVASKLPRGARVPAAVVAGAVDTTPAGMAVAIKQEDHSWAEAAE